MGTSSDEYELNHECDNKNYMWSGYDELFFFLTSSTGI